MRKELRVSVAGDIHLGHKKNNAQSIVANLNKYFSNDAHFATIDMVIFVGDVFDEALWLFSEDIAHIDAWVARVLRLCKKHGVIIRVLEGTPSHDRGQSERFTIINDIHERVTDGSVDLKHVKTLSIEYLEAFDINILYVPDEWNHSTEKTLEEVKELMVAKGLSQVDFAAMHGNFEYQLPAHIKNIPRHNEAEYSALVKYLIFIGHIHLHSRSGKIVAQGSFDRLSHGEEGPKGFVSTIVQPDGTYTLSFVENAGAKKYVTVRCPYEDMEENLRLLDRKVKKLPPASYVRVESNYLNPILSNLDALKARWPLLIWTALAKGKDDKEETNAIADEYVYIPITVNKDNIRELVMSRLAKLDLSAEILARCTANLKEVERI